MLDPVAMLTPGSYRGPGGAEVALPSGDVTQGVVRIGDTVRRPRQEQSRAVAGYLRHLETQRFDGAPRFLGTDAQGRDVLDFMPGHAASQVIQPWVAEEDRLVGVAFLVRRLLGASTGYPLIHPDAPWFQDLAQIPDGAPPAPDIPDVVGHCDLTPQNVVFDELGRAGALIDFDLAGPTTRLREARNLALHWAPLAAPQDRGSALAHVDPIGRTCLIADALQLTHAEREAFEPTNRAAAQRSWHLMHANAVHHGGGWARMWEEGVGDTILRRQSWLDDVGPQLAAALMR